MSRKATAAAPLLRFVCSRDFCESRDVQDELGPDFDLGLALLPFAAVLLDDKGWRETAKGMAGTHLAESSSPSLMAIAVRAICSGKDKDGFKELNASALDALEAAADEESLASAMKTAAKEPKHHDPALFSVLLALAERKLVAK